MVASTPATAADATAGTVPGVSVLPAAGASQSVDQVALASFQSTTPAQQAVARLNLLRQVAGLTPLAEDAAASQAAAEHVSYLLTNRVASHTQDSSMPGYSAAGDRAGRTGNVWASLSGAAEPDANHQPGAIVDDWVGAPFHGLVLMQPNLPAVGFAHEFRSGVGSAATMPVFFADSTPLPTTPAQPVLFPGPGSTIDLTTFPGNEYPNPLSGCPQWAPTRTVGLPILVQLPAGERPTRAKLQIDGRAVPDCELRATTRFATDATAAQTAQRILGERNAIVIIPAEPLTVGTTVNVSLRTNRRTIRWSFNVGAEAVAASPAG